jgi:FtsZ-interacting cell division protein ZipA
MNEIILIILVVAIFVVLAAVGWWAWRRQRSEKLKQRFGPEYEHVVAEKGDRRAAESELAARRKRFEKLDIRPLTPEERSRFAQRWQQTQARFVDSPTQATVEADMLVEEVMRARGYPVEEIQQREADISNESPVAVQHYRAAWEIAQLNARGEANTEDLRQAIVHYRALFEDLLAQGATGDRTPAAGERPPRVHHEEVA